MEEIITKDNLNTYTQGLKSVLSSMGEAIQNAGQQSNQGPVEISGYIIDQRDGAAKLPNSIIVKDKPSMNCSDDEDVIHRIWSNSFLCGASSTPSSTSGVLQYKKLSLYDKQKYLDNTSVPYSDAVFLKLPQFWYKCEELSTDVYQISFSMQEQQLWNHWEGNTFIGVYKYSSSSYPGGRGGVSHTNGRNVASMINTIQGKGYDIVDYECHKIMALLGFGWAGTTDIGSVIGRGNTDTSKFTNTPMTAVNLGKIDTQANIDGDVPIALKYIDSNSITSYSIHTNFWGLCDWCSGYPEVMGGIQFTSNYNYYIPNSSGRLVETNDSYYGNGSIVSKICLGPYGDVLPKEFCGNSVYDANVGFASIATNYSVSSYYVIRGTFSIDSYSYSQKMGLVTIGLIGSTDTSKNVTTRIMYKGPSEEIQS